MIVAAEPPAAKTDAELAKARVKAKATVEERIMKLILILIGNLRAGVIVCV